MKQIYSVIAAIILTTGIFYFTQFNSDHENITLYENEEDEDKLAEITGAMEFDFLKKHDPSTGKIPDGALWKAFTELKARGFYMQDNSDFRDEAGWKQINDFFPNLAVTKITYDPNNLNTFYFCTGEGWFNADAVKGAGVFKSSDMGTNWEQLAATNNSSYAYCQDIAVHPITSDVYVATKTGLYRSEDEGITFKKILGAGAGSIRNSICDIEITSDGGVFVGIGIFETDGIYYSPSGDSATFVKQINGFPSSGIFRIELATAPSNPDVCYAIPCSTSYKIKGIYKTIDRGTTWDTTSLPGGDYELAAKQAWYDMSLAVDPNNENVVVAGGLNIWRTQDGGINWQQLTAGRLDSLLVRYMHVDQHDIIFQNSDTVYFTNDGGIYKCDNFTADFPVIYPVNYNYNVTQFYATAIHPDEDNPGLLGGTQDNGSLLALNFGVSDFKAVSGADGAFCAFNSADGNKFYTTTQYRRIFRFDNGGFELPDTITNAYVEDDNLLFINPIEISPYDTEVLFQASSIGLWRLRNVSTADTSDWEKACAITGTISTIGTSLIPEDIIFIGKNSGNGEIYMINNATTSDGTIPPVGLDPLDQLPDAALFGSLYCSSISADVNDANHLLISYANYGVNSIWETTNALSGAPAWQSAEGDMPDVPVNNVILHPHNPDVAYAATELGVFYTNDLNGSATQWIPCSTFPIVRTDIFKIRLIDNTIIAGTHGRGIWEAKLDPAGIDNDINWIERGPKNVGGRTRALMIDPNILSGKKVWAGSVSGGLWKTTDIDAVDIDELNMQSLIFNVYPNPASDIAAIEIKNTTNTKYTIEVFDINAKKIETLASDKIISSLQLNVSNYKSGIYFIAVSNGKNKSVKKVVVN
ncbi:MAG: T9SS type A sorting domain-containing protein [Fimbriimonadaceae bacterium]|nr:T9SS type A sorting domain-containing protein [Chitinophagales bacterium]